ncbi:MAG: methyltransferase domain-containing protein [Nitrososphaeraceae archaeon]
MKKVKKKSELVNISHLTFTVIGLACHAICLIERAGILKILKNHGDFRRSQLKSYRNPHLVKAALATLVGAKVLLLKDGIYALTDLGESLARNMGTIMIPFIGYRKLLVKQFELLQHPRAWKEFDIDYPAIALASIEFGLSNLDPVLMDVFKSLKPKGTICDLGCGTGEKLVKICKALGVNGLGIEKSSQVIKKSKKFTRSCSQVEIIKGDIFNLRGVWEDIEIAMISQVYHDIHPLNRCVKFLNSLSDHFPRLRCLIVADIVSLSESLPSIMPGFDYVHGLQGVTPRSYEETIETFTKAGFNVFKEVAIPNMPNTFIWVIKQEIINKITSR